MVLGGPLGRIIVQVVIPVIATLVRAIPAAYGQALQNARRSGAAAEAASAVTRKRISKDEAMQILNLSTEQEITPAAIQKQYEKYFAANAVQKGGGSFYIQSKVYRAKEMLDEYIAEKTNGTSEDNASSQSSNDDESSSESKKNP